MMPFTVVLRIPTVDEYLQLRRSVDWSMPDSYMAKEALVNSVAAGCAQSDEGIVGMARVVGDRALYWYVQDVIVRPEWQDRGVGRALMTALEAEVRRLAPGGVSIGLVTGKEAEGFYRRLGYVEDSIYMIRQLG